MSLRRVCLVLVLTAAGVAPAVAQSSSEATTALAGTVVDAATGEPLEGASVTLEPTPAGLVAGSTVGTAGFVSTSRLAITGRDGGYAFRAISPGSYRLRVVRIGYRSTSVDVQYDGPTNPRVSVGLELSPVMLEPLEIVAPRHRPPTAPRAGSGATSDLERVAIERLRQARHLTPDTRVITDADVVEAVTLGETDLLRALHRLPGVTADDDFSAEPWTRGSRWDETRVYFDGVPLYDPFHLGGVSTAISPDAIGTMTFHSGLSPVEAGAASAGVVDLRSRAATGAERLTGLAQISLLNGRFSADRPMGEGSGITVSGRRSFVRGSRSVAGPTGRRSMWCRSTSHEQT